MRTTNERPALSANDETRAAAVPGFTTLGKVRLKLCVFTAASITAALVGLPGWTQGALVAITLMIPIAVAAQSGWDQVPLIFLPNVVIRAIDGRVGSGRVAGDCRGDDQEPAGRSAAPGLSRRPDVGNGQSPSRMSPSSRADRRESLAAGAGVHFRGRQR